LAQHSTSRLRDEEKQITRDEWMLVPPKQEDWSQRVDPTKIKNRKFQTGKGSKAPIAKGGDNALWTESPQQKMQRLNDEVMGIKKPATQTTDETKLSQQLREEAAETKRRIEEYNVSQVLNYKTKRRNVLLTIYKYRIKIAHRRCTSLIRRAKIVRKRTIRANARLIARKIL